jgi:hypothetical protein
MSSSEKYQMLWKKRTKLKAIKNMLIQLGCSVKTLEQINHELDKTQNDINNLIWW